MPGKDTISKAQSTTRVAEPGDGIRQVKTTNVFRLINFELYTRPVSFICNCFRMHVINTTFLRIKS